MTVKATFVGTDSAGYVHGQTYKLKVTQFRGMTIIKKDDETDKVTYKSSIAFLKNWSNIITNG